MRSLSILLATAMLLQVTMAMPQSAEARARRYTITQRHNALVAKINRFQRSGELTLKEADSLRNENADILRREARLKSKNGGKLSYKDIAHIEDDLNDLSNKIHKKSLNKRVQE
ncbi:hypothetical protein BH11CYA1_BH11CYA1_47730 [soil metagenome]